MAIKPCFIQRTDPFTEKSTEDDERDVDTITSPKDFVRSFEKPSSPSHGGNVFLRFLSTKEMPFGFAIKE
ncbi:hypothetical protein L6452_11103 [Arctium lappa]|uniref:Uncharacterized protein n=1 Tax=Arctium lappa TaxID=4217 RepID=A0ACB9DNB7_ARCLA|nr:hypothetical protein L6452_11103 [Arctium lappa]